MKTVSILLFGLFSASLAFAVDFEIDPGHSSVNFSVRHLVVSKTRGKFDKFNGEFSFEEGKPEAWKVNATVDTASINTAEKKRDEHLRSPDFFDVAKFPTMTFKSSKVTDYNKADKTAKLHGDLTLHGVTKTVVFNLEIGGMVKDPWGNEKAGFTATTKINRKDFGLTWNKVLETGGLAVGEDVEIALEVEGNVKKTEAKRAKK